MSFPIVLQKNASPANQLTKVLTTKYTLTGELKDGSSIVDPVVIVEIDNFPSDCNYATIAAFDRQYFIKDIKSTSYNMWEISLHCDVISSFAAEIRQLEAIIGKQENQFNLYLSDGNYKCYQNPHIITKMFPAGFSASNFSYVLALASDKQEWLP